MSSRIRAAQKEALRPAACAMRMSAVALLFLSACSTDNPMSLRPDVDIGERTASLAADTSDIPVEQPMPDYAADQADMAAAVDYGTSSEDVYKPADNPYASSSLSPPEMGGGTLEEPDMAGAATEPVGSETGEETIRPLSMETGDTSAFEPATTEMAGTTTAGPGVSEHHIDSLDQLNPAGSVDPVGSADSGGSADAVDPVDQANPPAQEAPTEPYLIAALPRVDNPVVKPRNVMPADEVDCRADLKRLGVAYKNLPAINDGEACGIDYPVKVSAIGKVKMVPAATLRCEMAATVAAWTKKELIPAARSRYLTGVKAIHQASSYSCRNINRSRTLSEHGKGNALDIARIELNSGRDIDVRKPGLFSFRQKGFLNSVRSDGCEYFSTVLGPGYNHDHRDHFHFDLKQRRSGHRACR
jgi:hypothetical protein